MARGADPFKKYWWVILVGFGGIGAWICLPLVMDAGIGSGSVKASEGSLSAQSLDNLERSTGAPGKAMDMPGGAYAKRAGSTMKSSLYEAPPEEKAAETPAAPAAAGGSLADALRDVAKSGKASASVDPSGWGGAQATKGFTAPKAAFGSMSGLGGGSSGSGASSSGMGAAGGSSFSSGGFGGRNADVAFTQTKGLQNASAAGGGRAMGALESARGQAVAAAKAGTGDAASNMASRGFDGGGGGGAIGGNMAGTSGQGVYGSLDAAPINLKANDPNLSTEKFEPPPQPQKTPEPENPMKMMMMMMLMQVVMGGLMMGLGGGMA